MTILANKIFQNTLIVLLSILLSGSIFFYHSKILLITCTFFTFIIFLNRKIKFDKEFLSYSVFILILFISQVLTFQFFSFPSLIGLFLVVFYPYLTIKTVGKDYFKIYTKILYVFTIISFVFYIPSLLSDTIHELIGKIPLVLGTDKDNLQNFIIYTWEPKNGPILRNSGPFWEPGAFSGFLIIAIIFETFRNKKLLTKYNTIFYLGIVSTFSTAGYITLIVYLGLYFIFQKNVYYKITLLPAFIIIAWYAFFNIDFLSNKIVSNIEDVKYKNDVSVGRGRFTSAVIDLEDVIKYPITGRGRNSETRFDKKGEDYMYENHRTNGVTDYAVKYGLIGFFVYVFMMYRSFEKFAIYYSFSKSFALILILTIFTASFSQGYLQQPSFVALIYLGYLFPNSLKRV